MKTAAFLFALCLSASAFAAEKTENVKVNGWHCDNCPKKTAAAMEKIDGVKSAKANRKKGVVTVTFDDSKVKQADLDKAVADSGFEVGK